MTEKKIRWIAGALYIVLHVGICVWPLSSRPLRLNTPMPPKSVAVQIALTEPTAIPIEKKTVHTRKKKKKRSKNTDRKLNNMAVTKKPSPKKKVKHVGDQKTATVLSSVSPITPKTALNLGLEGTVIVKLIIDAKGRIVQQKVTSSSGHTILDDAFLKVLSEYKFKPKQVNGEKMLDTLTVQYKF